MDNEAEVEPVREKTNGEVKQMLSEYRAIADMDDAEYTTYQRQLREQKDDVGAGRDDDDLELGKSSSSSASCVNRIESWLVDAD